MIFECGRAEKCNECLELPREAAIDVCIAVGKVMGLPYPEDLNYQEIHDITYHCMIGTVDDDDWVTPEMKQAAAESAYQLIIKKD